MRRRLLINNNIESDMSIPIVRLTVDVEPENFPIFDSDMMLYTPPGDYEESIHKLIAYYENNYLTSPDNVLNLYNHEFEIITSTHSYVSVRTITFVNDRITIVGVDELENPWHGTVVNEFTEIQIDGYNHSVVPGSIYFRRLLPITEYQQYKWTNTWTNDNGMEYTEEYIIARDSCADSYSIPPATAFVECYNIVENNYILNDSEYEFTIQGESGHVINIGDILGYDDGDYSGNISIIGMDNNSNEWRGFLMTQNGSVTIDTGAHYPVYVGDIFIHIIPTQLPDNYQ